MARISQNLIDAFMARTRTDQVLLVINDAVNIVSGEYKGKVGSVISIVSIDPELTFLVELSDGKDVTLPLSSLQLMN